MAAACLLGLAQGCRLPSGASASASRPPSSQSDEYEGWLFRSLTGQKQQPSPATQSPPSPAALGQAPTGGTAGPGPATPESVQQVAGLATSSAGETPNRGTVLPPAGVDNPKPDEDNRGFDWSDLYPSTIYKNLKKAVGLGPDERVARAAYAEGETLYRQKKYREAAEKFRTAASRWPDSPLEEDALFMLAESLFFSDQYPKALDTYGELLKKHEYSRYLDRAVARQFAIGRYWEQFHAHEPHWPTTPNFTDGTRPLFDTWGHAIKAYESVRLNDPTGPLADDAVMAIANAHFIRQHYEEAAYNYDLLRKEYPKSEHQLQAHVLGMVSHLGMYQGPMYDGKPLDEAIQIADVALTQFRDRLGAEREYVLRARNQMIEQKAEREWAMGQYYDRRQYYRAARLHYQAVLKEYPQTRFARLAQARLEEIKDRPDRPLNHFEWIEQVLPSKRKK